MVATLCYNYLKYLEIFYCYLCNMSRLILSLSSICFLLVCCTQIEYEDTASVQNLCVVQDNHVSEQLVRDLISRLHPTKGDTPLSYSLEAYKNSENDTLMYIVNYGANDGWQIFSSDIRTPAVIAEGNKGYFSFEEGSPAVRIWMSRASADIAAIRKSSDEMLSFSSEEISANKQVWTGTDGGNRGVPVELGGHWEETITYETIVDDDVDHMTPHWAQGSPYNAYCPFEINSTTNRAPAGCVAIAASGVLYYLHGKLGTPATMVDYGYCFGDIDSFTNYFSGNSTSVWSQMSSAYNQYSADAEALMIAHVGDVVGMHYCSFLGNYYSWALPDHIRTNLFSMYGLSCSNGSYNESLVKSNLENRLPIIVTASDCLVPADFDIHTFVIDGFIKTHKRYIHYHYWVPDDPLNPEYILPIHEYDPYYTYSYTTSTITAIRINWGWASQWVYPYYNDGTYALTANWLVNDGNELYEYEHNVSMLYNMAVSN